MLPYEDAIARVQDADREAIRAEAAFVLGKFPEYFDGKVAEARHTLEVLHEQNAPEDDRGSGGGHPAGG